MKELLPRALALTVYMGNKYPLPKQSLSIDQELIWSFALLSMENHQLQGSYCHQRWMQIAYAYIINENPERKLWFLFRQNTQIGRSCYLTYFF